MTSKANRPRSMQVPLLDLKTQYAALRDEVERAIREVCDGQQFVLGPRVAELEARIAAYSGAAFGIGVSSGTDALLVALMAMDVGPGDAVVTSPYTFFATAGVIARLGARPIFCDIDPATFNLAPSSVLAFVESRCERTGGVLTDRLTGSRVRAIMPVHLYGQMAQMDALLEIARRYGLRVVEDAAQAIGAQLADGRRAGGVGDVGCFSFFPSKNLGAFGDAGMCVTSDPELAERIRVLRVHGGAPKYHHAVVGGNFRLDELQAAVLLVKLGHLDEWTDARRRNAARYTEAIEAAGIRELARPPTVASGDGHVFHQYVIGARRRDELRAYLGEHGVGTEIYYPLSLHEQECFSYLGYRAADLPNASRAAAESLALPIYPELTIEQLEHVVHWIAAFYAGSGGA